MVLVVASVVLLTVAATGVSGAVLFTYASSDALRVADAVVVLGGEHDGREEYGLQLVREGYAPVLLLSDPYSPADPLMRRFCDGQMGPGEVICGKPEPSTTRGEAMLTRRLANARGWRTVIVVSWRYHLPRARYIFNECFSSEPGSLIMTPVPRAYEFSVARWEYTYAYQYAGIAKAVFQGSCE